MACFRLFCKCTKIRAEQTQEIKKEAVSKEFSLFFLFWVFELKISEGYHIF